MSIPIILNRGPEATIPTLQNGEPAWTTDTHKVFVGDGTTNHEISPPDDAGGVVAAQVFGN